MNLACKGISGENNLIQRDIITFVRTEQKRYKAVIVIVTKDHTAKSNNKI